VEGRSYRLKYRVQNRVGWSDFSAMTSLKVADVPDAPPAPIFYQATGSTIILQLLESTNNHGSEITSYELMMDQGFGTEFALVESYNDEREFTVTGLTEGTIHTFKYAALNEIGRSEYSSEVRIAVSRPPVKPAAPTKNIEKSTRTSIFVEWEAGQPTEVPILGYKLYMAHGTSEYKLVYAEQNPLIREFNVTFLTSGSFYQFKLVATNFNGDSEMSDPLERYSCLPPSEPAVPQKVSGTRTQLKLKWSEPEDGGCHITSYNLFRDAGDAGLIATEVDPQQVADNSSKLDH
jgi:hypothetical protein